MALYFAWLGWYTYMLVPAALVGLLIFLSGFALFDASQIRWAGWGPWLGPGSGQKEPVPAPSLYPSKEICEARDILLCPLGHQSRFQPLSSTCTFAKVCHPGHQGCQGHTCAPRAGAECGVWGAGRGPSLPLGHGGAAKPTSPSPQLTHLFDNEGTVLFAIFMALWGESLWLPQGPGMPACAVPR